MTAEHIQWAELAGERLQVQEVRERHARDLVRHRFPGRDGAEHRDTGAEASEWTVQATFLDWQGTEYWESYRNVLAAMNNAATVTWQPPHGDSQQVRIESIDGTTSTEGTRAVRATLQLVADTSETATFTADERGLDALAQDFDEAAKEAEEALETLLAAQAGGGV